MQEGENAMTVRIVKKVTVSDSHVQDSKPTPTANAGLASTIFTTFATAPKTVAANITSCISSVSPAADTDNVAFVGKSKEHCPCPEKITDEQVKLDCQQLMAMELRAKYPREATSHKSMKGRQKSKGAVIHPDFMDFRSFLRIVGPMPAKGATLDRIDNKDPEYAPGKVRWADKHTQSNNKSDNLIFHDPVTGAYLSAAQIAAKQGVAPATIGKRRKRGWTDQQIIAGTTSSQKSPEMASTITAHGPIWHKPGEWLDAWHKAMRDARKQKDLHRQQRLVVMKDIYDRKVADYRNYRKEHPEEYELILMDHRTMNRKVYKSDEPDMPICYLQWLEMFREVWPAERLHVIFERCSPYDQKAIEMIDPEYVRKHQEALAKKAQPQQLP
jgi:hypothetical protein